MKSLMIFVLIVYCMTACGKDESKAADGGSTVINTPTDLNGRDGATGANGKDGQNGKDGKDGVNGKDGALTEQNQWDDLVTGKIWVMGAVGNQLAATTVCSGSYRVPTAAELSDACYRGLFKVYASKLGAPAQTVAWASGTGDIITISSCLATTQSNGLPGVLLCIQK